MKIKLDGHECHTVADESLTGAPDAKLMDICRSEQRMLVAFDLRFGDVRVYPPSSHAGIVLLRLRDQQPDATTSPPGSALDARACGVGATAHGRH